MNIAYAAADASLTYANSFLDKIKTAILFPLISLMMGVAILVFLWGVFEMVYGAADSEARIKGRSHIMWGLIGFVVMLSALTILRIAANTVGVQLPA